MTRGLVHRGSAMGLEVVAAVPMDGSADPGRYEIVAMETDAAFSVISVEDLIADRIGQYASGTAPDMLFQARNLFDLYPELDRAYLDSRIREESCGDYDVGLLTDE